MYKKVSTDLNFVEREKEILEYWREHDVFKKSMELREEGPTFTFYDGPPTANGKPHIGHIITRAFKDLIPRYRTMKGYHVLRKAGWDTHGLPVELEVEKTLGLNGKEQIEEYGIEPFNKMCKESVWKYQSEWERMSDRVGYWADMENPYITYNDNYIESEWWALKQIHEKGLIYQGHKIVPYCPRCGTALSSHEVSQGYKTVKERSAIVRFRVKGEENTFLYAWTTTPWTLPSNVALCVNPEDTYAKFDFEGRTIIMAEALIDSVLGEDAAIENKVTMPGKELAGMRYEPLFDFQREILKGVQNADNAWIVTCDDYVTMSDGTGIVHIAPAFGEDDARVGRDNALPFLQLVNTKGEMEKGTPWAGTFIKQADPLVLEDLKSRDLLVAAPEFTHDYPFCWRCDTPLVYYARGGWFIRMTEVRDKLMENNRTVNWMPDNIKEGRMGNFLDNVIDWALSRERYWGTPLPAWICKDCGHIHFIGSRQELIEMGHNVPADIELHRPYIDGVEITCPKCSGTMHRTPEVIDCWFDSGSMPFAQWHYPFENQDIFEQNFPADYISEAIDQTRGWFYSLQAISTLLFDKSPYKNCLVLGLVCDKNGVKMSKHIGNVISPWDVLDKQGADAVRWYFYSGSAPWLPSRMSLEAVSEAQRKFMGTLWNTYAFFVLYADIDSFDPTKYTLDYSKLPLMDKWVLSKLNTLIKLVDENLNEYSVTDCARAMTSFVDELSNWYVRTGRERFWASGMEQDKINAYMTLHTVLTTMAKLSAPFTPFMAEQIYTNLVCTVDKTAPVSVHLCDFPVCNEEMINKELENDMDMVLRCVVLGRAARNGANIKNRQPLQTLYIQGCEQLSSEYCDIIRGELNIKDVKFIEDARALTTYKVKPQLRTVGPKYGKLVGKIGKALSEFDGNEIVDALDTAGAFNFELEGTAVSLTRDDLLLEKTQKEGFMAESERELTVIIDTNLTEELISEGFVREITSKIQTMRKEAGFEVMDKITVCISTKKKLAAVIEANASDIASDTMANSVTLGDVDAEGYVKDWDINGVPATISVKR